MDYRTEFDPYFQLLVSEWEYILSLQDDHTEEYVNAVGVAASVLSEYSDLQLAAIAEAALLTIRVRRDREGDNE